MRARCGGCRVSRGGRWTPREGSGAQARKHAGQCVRMNAATGGGCGEGQACRPALDDRETELWTSSSSKRCGWRPSSASTTGNAGSGSRSSSTSSWERRHCPCRGERRCRGYARLQGRIEARAAVRRRVDLLSRRNAHRAHRDARARRILRAVGAGEAEQGRSAARCGRCRNRH